MTFEQVQLLLQPLINGQEALVNGQKALVNGQKALFNGQKALANGQGEMRAELVAAEIRRVRKEMNCWITNYRTIQESTEFKLAVIGYYGRAVSVVHGKIVSARCMVSDVVAQYGELRPAHLVKHSTPHLMAFYSLSPLEVDHPRNGMLMLDAIEKAFDHLDVCFL